MNKRSLPSALPNDMLGDSAEKLFDWLCSRAGLVCNKSDRDRAGWDFIIDFPFQPAPGVPLDKRQKIRCNVQLKATIKASDRTVSLKLSAADQIAKEPQPAFVIVFRMRSDGEPLKGYLIHLLNAPLARVLRRLRDAEARGLKTHKLQISFDYRKLGTPFDLTPEGLQQAIEQACGADPSAYVREKLHQLESLGYENGQVAGTAFFQVDGDTQLTRVLLGLEPMRPTRLEAFDVRFGIPIPLDSAFSQAITEITLEPPVAGRCTIAISGQPLTPPAVFEADLVVLPSANGAFHMVARHPDFTITFRETAAAIEADFVFADRPRPLDDLIMVLRALLYLSSGQGSVSLSLGRGRPGVMHQELSMPLKGPYLEDLPTLARLATDWKELLALAGVCAMASLRIDDLWEGSGVALAADLMLRSTQTAHFAFDADQLPDAEGAIKAIYFDSCGLGGDSISYAVQVTLGRSPTRAGVYQSTGFRPLDVRARVPDLNDYMDDLHERFGNPVMIHPDNISRVEPADLEGPVQRGSALPNGPARKA